MTDNIDSLNTALLKMTEPRYKTVIISQDLSAGAVSSFTHYISVNEFIPDEMIIKNITFVDATAAPLPPNTIVMLNCSLVPTYPIAMFPMQANLINKLDSRFQLPGNYINTEVAFYFTEADGTTGQVMGYIALHLEFVKH